MTSNRPFDLGLQLPRPFERAPLPQERQSAEARPDEAALQERFARAANASVRRGVHDGSSFESPGLRRALRKLDEDLAWGLAQGLEPPRGGELQGPRQMERMARAAGRVACELTIDLGPTLDAFVIQDALDELEHKAISWAKQHRTLTTAVATPIALALFYENGQSFSCSKRFADGAAKVRAGVKIGRHLEKEAAFAQLFWKASERLRVSASARYDFESAVTRGNLSLRYQHHDGQKGVTLVLRLDDRPCDSDAPTGRGSRQRNRSVAAGLIWRL